MRWKGPLRAYALGALILAAMALAQVTVAGFGFPDGHATALERAYDRVWQVAAPAAGLLSLNFMALGFAARRSDKKAWFRASLVVLVLLAVGAAASVLVLRLLVLRGQLDDGSGG